MSSTISITYKLQGDAKTFKELTKQADGLKGAFTSTAEQADQLPKKLGGVRSAASGIMKSLGGLAAGVLSVRALVNVLKGAVETMKKFERANSELASVLGKSSSEISNLTQAATDLGRTTEYTASEVTQLQTALARLGFSDTQILSMQESVLKFAAAVGTDLSSAADFAGSTLRSFGLKASDSKEILDIMAASTSKSALSFSKLQTSMAIVGPVAKTFGLTARDTVSLLGVLSNAGFDASSSATALRNILLEAAKANGKFSQGLGYSVKTMPDIIGALKDLRDRGADLNETLAMTDNRSVSAFNALIRGADDVEALHEALGDCDGALDEMYMTMTDNLEGAVKGLASAWEGLVLQFRNSLEPMKGVVNWLSKVVNKFSDAVKVGVFRFRAQKTNSLLDEYTRQYAGDPSGLDAAIEEARKAYGMAKGPDKRRTTYRTLWLLEEVKANQKLAASAKAAEEAVEGLNEAEAAGDGDGGRGGGGSKKKTLAQAIREYSQEVERAVQVNQALGSSTKDIDAKLKAMESGLSDIIKKYGSESDAVKKLVQDYQELLRVRRDGATKYALDGTGLTPLTASVTSKPKSPIPALGSWVKQARASVPVSEALRETLTGLSGAFHDVAGSVGEAAAAWLNWIGNLLSAVSQAIPALMSLAAAKKAEATANTAAMATGAGSAVASVPLVGPVLALSAIASVLAAIMNLPKFAKGGVISGPTLGLMGEYTGAAHNPEVIAPLNTLRQYIQPATLGGDVEFRLRGRDLYGSFRKESRLKSRG